jgi:GalNAc-alpha-(1->4)-GalNAc-alpha-(1->3)-diNAcBac-PP-undecaprenol alpha-1,4-N-acetyl-D-galactosaminyltransferase
MTIKRLCLVIPSLSAGGMERVMSELAIYFSGISNLDVHLIILGKGKRFYDIPTSVTVHEPDFYFNNKYRIYHTFKMLWLLRKSVKYIKPHAILSFGEMYNSFVLLGTLFLNMRVYVSDRSKPDKRWGKVHETMRKILYNHASGIVAQTNYSRQFLEKEIKHTNICVIPNPVQLFNKTPKEKKNIILNVGRLIKTKRIDILINLFSKTNFSDWELWIVGDGPELHYLENISRDKKLTNKVKFWGNQKNVQWYYSQADIFAFTSVSEGFPNALLEALSAGIACISFDCVAGPADLIKNGENGILIKEMEEKSYLHELSALMDNVEIRQKLGAKAMESVSKYEISKIGESYLKFLQIK